MFLRRDILKLGVATIAVAASSGIAAAQGKDPLALLGDGRPFSFQSLQELARDLAKKPFQALSAALPDVFGNLSNETYAAIRLKREALIWAGEPGGFVIEPLHRGFVFATPVQLHLVEDGQVRRIAYQLSRYEFGKLAVQDTVGDIGFSGFRIHGLRDGKLEESMIFQGASFFRSRAKGQNLGAMARALAIKTADPRGEEFPFFRAFWIERPQAGTGAITVNALADSESATAAFRFTIRPGDATIIDTEASLYPRVAIDHVGYAPMQSTYLFGPNSRRTIDDVRPNVYESSGLQIVNGNGEWIWRPVQNPENLQVSAFVDQNPRGFGLIQRERDPASFYDAEQHWEARPSVWIEPLGEWGAGSVQLVEIPSDSEVNDNIIAYWRPKQTLAPGGEMSFAYRQYWVWSPPEKTPLAQVRTTRIGKLSGRQKRILVEFGGENSGAIPTQPEFKLALTASPGTIANVRTSSDGPNSFRVMFDFDPAGETISEMRLVLEGAGKPLSETWLYRWTQ